MRARLVALDACRDRSRRGASARGGRASRRRVTAPSSGPCSGMRNRYCPACGSRRRRRSAASLAGRADLVGGDDTLPAAWLQRSALVRPELEAFAGLMMHTEASGRDVPAQLGVVQLPHRPGAPWLARPFGDSGVPPHGSVGIVIHSWTPLDPSSRVRGPHRGRVDGDDPRGHGDHRGRVPLRRARGARAAGRSARRASRPQARTSGASTSSSTPSTRRSTSRSCERCRLPSSRRWGRSCRRSTSRTTTRTTCPSVSLVDLVTASRGRRGISDIHRRAREGVRRCRRSTCRGCSPSMRDSRSGRRSSPTRASSRST